MPECVIHWFRRDLRLEDNTALNAALVTGVPVAPVFILDERILGRGGIGPARLAFLRTALLDLDARLRERGSRLVVGQGDAPRELSRLAEETEAWGVYFNRDYTPYARQRDTRMTRGMQLTGVVSQAFDDLLLVTPHDTMDEAGAIPWAFEEFETRWLQAFDITAGAATEPEGPGFLPADLAPEAPDGWPETLGPGLPPSTWPGATPESARQSLAAFVAADLDEGAGSGLAAALKFGTVSVREVARAALRRAAAEPQIRAGAEAFVRRLARRDHANHVLFARPDLGAALPQSADEDSQARLEAWIAGRTGVAAVDDAMRRLRDESFLTHEERVLAAGHLKGNKAAGERHFRRHLVDYDVALSAVGWHTVT